MLTSDHLPARRARRAPRHRRRPALPTPRPGRGVRHARRGAPARASAITEASTRPAPCPSSSVHNPLDASVLLYDGEELVGAKQNRILNVTVLVEAERDAPHPRLLRRAGPLAARPAPRSARPTTSRTPPAPPQGRDARRAAARARGRAGRGVGRGAREGRAHGVSARRRRRPRTRSSRTASLRELEAEFPLQPGQCGALLALGDNLCLDGVSRPDAFAALAEAPRRLPARRARAARQARATSVERVSRFVDASPRRATRSSRRSGSATTSACAAKASSAPGSSSTASCSSSRRSRATRGRAGVRPDRAAEPAALDVVAGLVRREEGPPRRPRRRRSSSRRASRRRPCRAIPFT